MAKESKKGPQPIDCDSCQLVKDCQICIGGDGERMIVNSCSTFLPKAKAEKSKTTKPEPSTTTGGTE